MSLSFSRCRYRRKLLGYRRPGYYLQRQDNPRLVEAEAEIMRGDIVDRNGNVLVTSIKNSDQNVTRRYLYPELYSALGYSSLRYGVSGAEAAFNTTLRGDDLQNEFKDQFLRDLLHLSKQGLTFG